jgi:phage-related minor tail protein
MGIQETTKLAEDAVKHFADLTSFHNGNVEEVAAAWQSAIRGQYEPIQKYFPFINDAFLKTYGTANGLIDANTKTLTANQRAIILNAIAFNEELNPALNDFAETSGGLANSSRELQSQFQNMLITLGTNLLPIALKVVTALNSMLEKFNQLNPTQQKMILLFAGLVAIAGPVLSALGSIVSIVSGVVGAVGSLSALGISLAGIGGTISAVVVPAVAAIGAALLPILAVIASLILLAGLFAIAWKTNFLGIRDIINTSVKFWTNLFKAFFAFLRGDTEGAMEYLKEAWQSLVDHVTNVFSKFSGLRDAWLNFLGWVQDALTNIINYISNAFSRIDWGQLGRFVVLGIANGMLLGIPSLISAALRAAESALAAIKARLGISSPSKAFAELGMFSGQGFQLGLARAMSAEDIARTMARPVNQIANSQQQVINNHFSSGLTIREVRNIVDERNEQLINTMLSSLEGR